MLEIESRPHIHQIVDSLERVRMTARVPQQEWLDLLGLHWDDYQGVKMGEASFGDKALERLSQRFHFSSEDFLKNKVDYRSLALASEVVSAKIPPRYLKAAYGRRRASINSVDFIEKLGGWRLRHDLLEALDFPESALSDPFATISVHFMSDVCAYLHRRQFEDETLFAMGAGTYEATRDTLVGKIFATLSSVKELYEHFFSDCMQLFEANCDYRLTSLSTSKGVVEVRSNSHVAECLGVKDIGNKQLCVFKAGMIACIPRYLGRPQATVRETQCVHSGDECCRFEFSFSDVANAR